MNCEVCQQPLNLSDRYPYLLPCCHESICKECMEELNGTPQNETFLCPFQQCAQNIQCNVKFIVNKPALKLLQSLTGIFCDSHPNKYVEYYCKDNTSLICSGCALTDHKNHNMVVIEKLVLNEYNGLLLQKLKVEQDKINSLIMELQSYQDNQRQLTNTQYMKLIKEAQETLLYRIKNQDEQERIKFLNAYLEQIEHQVRPLIDNIDSVLIQTQDDFLFLQDSLAENKLKLQLLYRGSRDGFSAQCFHDQCDKKGPTLMLAKSEHGKVFGGYAFISWENIIQEKFKSDNKAFIFSLDNRIKFNQYQNYEMAITHDNNYGPVFGQGCDIMIRDNCDQNYNNAYLGGTYNTPDGIVPKSNIAKQYLGGSEYFRLQEIEVFKVL